MASSITLNARKTFTMKVVAFVPLIVLQDGLILEYLVKRKTMEEELDSLIISMTVLPKDIEMNQLLYNKNALIR